MHANLYRKGIKSLGLTTRTLLILKMMQNIFMAKARSVEIQKIHFSEAIALGDIGPAMSYR